MDEPDTSIQNGVEPEAADLRVAAMAAGWMVEMADLPVSLETLGQRPGDYLTTLVGGLPAPEGPARLRVVVGSRTPTVPLEDADQSYWVVRVWRRGERLVVMHGDRFGAEVGSSEAYVGGPGMTDSDALRQMFPLVLAHLLGFHDRFVLHGGAIAAEGGALLVVGRSGAGKSTVVFAGAEAGWQAVTDDIVVVRHRDGEPELTGLGLPLTVPVDVAEHEGPSTDARRRRTVPSSAGQGWHRVVGVLAPRHSADPAGDLEVIEPGDRFELVLGSFQAAGEPLLVRRYAPVAASIARLPGWRLGLSSDSARRVADIGDLLGRLPQP